MTDTKPMRIKDAVADVHRAALEDAARFCDSVRAAREWLYLVESCNRAGDFRTITLAVPFIDERTGYPSIEFFWPHIDSANPEAIKLLGASRAMDEAAKAVGFTMKRRSFAVGGGGMDMAWDTMYRLACRAYGRDDDPRVLEISQLDKRSMSRVN